MLALQFPISKINRLMTMDRRWQESGMGKTGETFIVGPDDLMRSDSRLFLEDPEAYKRDVISAGTPPDVAEEAIRQQRHHAGSAGAPPTRPNWPSAASAAR